MTLTVDVISDDTVSTLRSPIERGPVRILVVDDEDAVRISLGELLRRHRYAVDVAADGEEALERLRHSRFDLVLLDLLLPDLSGMEVARHARVIQPEAKIILLTGHGTLQTALESMHLGIFDYLLKTESTPTVLSRIAEAAELCREQRHKQQLLDELQNVIHELAGDAEPVAQPYGMPQTLNVGPLQISPWQQTVHVGEHAVRLTTTELHLLVHLAQRAGQVLTYHELARFGLGSNVRGAQAAELIKPHIYHLRHKLEPDPSNPRYILTVRGVGYLLVNDTQDA